jgi:ABC-type phosphate transport system substrate-binding protein
MRIAHFIQTAVAVLLATSLAANATAEVVVIVAADSPVNSVSASQVADIFLGKNSYFADGRLAVPLDLADGSNLRREFYAKATGMSPQLLKAY